MQATWQLALDVWLMAILSARCDYPHPLPWSCFRLVRRMEFERPLLEVSREMAASDAADRAATTAAAAAASHSVEAGVDEAGHDGLLGRDAVAMQQRDPQGRMSPQDPQSRMGPQDHCVIVIPDSVMTSGAVPPVASPSGDDVGRAASPRDAGTSQAGPAADTAALTAHVPAAAGSTARVAGNVDKRQEAGCSRGFGLVAKEAEASSVAISDCRT